MLAGEERERGRDGLELASMLALLPDSTTRTFSSAYFAHEGDGDN